MDQEIKIDGLELVKEPPLVFSLRLNDVFHLERIGWCFSTQLYIRMLFQRQVELHILLANLVIRRFLFFEVVPCNVRHLFLVLYNLEPMTEGRHKVNGFLVNIVGVEVIHLHVHRVKPFIPQVFRFDNSSAVCLWSTVGCFIRHSVIEDRIRRSRPRLSQVVDQFTAMRIILGRVEGRCRQKLKLPA